MFRYRCPHCRQVLMALEMRAGKTTICPKCSRALTIPADRSEWLNERGEPLPASPTVVISTAPPEVRDTLDDEDDPDADVLGAIGVEIPVPTDPTSLNLNFDPTAPKSVAARDPRPTPPPTPAFYRSIPQEPEAHAAPAAEVPAPAATLAPPRPPAAVARPSPRETPERPPLDPPPIRLRTRTDATADPIALLLRRAGQRPRPYRDLKPSTAVWLLATGAAAALLLATLLTTNDFARAAAYLGAAQVLGGYAWVVALAFRRGRQSGLLCALPPVTLWCLTGRRYARYRPLRFVVTGVVLIALAGSAGLATPHTRDWVGAAPSPPPAPEADVARQPVPVRLRHYRDHRDLHALTELVQALARPDPPDADGAGNKPEIAAELKALCAHPDVRVKVEAMAAYARWGGDDARAVCLAATRSPDRDERTAALRLLAGWRDAEVARAVADRVSRPGEPETEAAIRTLEAIGPPAERAIFPLLRSKDQVTRLTAIELLRHENVGGSDSVAELRALANLSDDPATRRKADTTARTIQDRLKQ
jgi:hypothetical protein